MSNFSKRVELIMSKNKVINTVTDGNWRKLKRMLNGSLGEAYIDVKKDGKPLAILCSYYWTEKNREKYEKTFKLLINHRLAKEPVDYVNNMGNTLLMQMIYQKEWEYAKILILSGCNVNIKNHDGKSAKYLMNWINDNEEIYYGSSREGREVCELVNALTDTTPICSLKNLVIDHIHVMFIDTKGLPNLLLIKNTKRREVLRHLESNFPHLLKKKRNR